MGKHYGIPSSHITEDLDNLQKIANEISSLYKASQSWFWRLAGTLVAIAAVTSAVFQVLSYFRG